MSELPDFNKITFTPSPPIPFEEILPDASVDVLDLLRGFLVYASKRRLPARDALLHKYFFSDPLPAHHSELPIPEGRRARHLLQHVHEYNLDNPLENTLLPPGAIPLPPSGALDSASAATSVQMEGLSSAQKSGASNVLQSGTSIAQQSVASSAQQTETSLVQQSGASIEQQTAQSNLTKSDASSQQSSTSIVEKPAASSGQH